MTNENKSVLAFYMPYGNEDNIIIYDQNDLSDSDIVKTIFDHCQILEGYITYACWLFLLKHYGYEGLYFIDQESGWFDTDSLDAFIYDVDLEMTNAKKAEFDTCCRDTL